MSNFPKIITKSFKGTDSIIFDTDKRFLPELKSHVKADFLHMIWINKWVRFLPQCRPIFRVEYQDHFNREGCTYFM